MRRPVAFSSAFLSLFRLPGRSMLSTDDRRLSTLNSSSSEAGPSSSEPKSRSWFDKASFALEPPLLVDFILKSIGASCEPAVRADDVDVDPDSFTDVTDNVALFSRSVDVVAADEFEWRPELWCNVAGKCGEVGGVIDTTISSLSISSSLSLFVEWLSFGEHCDFKTASKYRLVNSSADLLPVGSKKYAHYISFSSNFPNEKVIILENEQNSKKKSS